jgi:predicted deacylase
MKKKSNPLKICNETIQPGEKVSLALPLPELFSCAPLYMPIKVVHGKREGPCLLVIAAMQGDEYNGTEIVNRIMDFSALKHLHGTLIAVPVMNVYGLINRSRYLPAGVLLNRCFPGSQAGPHSARMAHIFTKEIFNRADYCVNLTTGPVNYTNLPQVHIYSKDKKAMTLAKTFNAPVVVSNPVVERGSLNAFAINESKPFITYEAGEALRFDPYAIKSGVRGIINIFRKLGMLPARTLHSNRENKACFTEKIICVHAASSGINHSKIKLGQHVQKGELLSMIEDPFGAGDDIPVHSTSEGIIIGKNNLPLVHEGNTLFQLAAFSQIKETASHLENWTEKNIEPSNGKTKQ